MHFCNFVSMFVNFKLTMICPSQHGWLWQSTHCRPQSDQFGQRTPRPRARSTGLQGWTWAQKMEETVSWSLMFVLLSFYHWSKKIPFYHGWSDTGAGAGVGGCFFFFCRWVWGAGLPINRLIYQSLSWGDHYHHHKRSQQLFLFRFQWQHPSATGPVQWINKMLISIIWQT